jgi:thiosulfate reductase cytochrome b subunit
MARELETLKLKHLLAIRWFHWINFPLLFLMIWSGLLIYWAYPAYHIGPIRLFSASLFKALHMDFRLADGMGMHFVFMWLFVINGVLYVAYTLISGEWRLLVPQSLSTFRDAWYVLLHDFGLHKDIAIQGKYNAAQQVSYSAIIVMGVGSVLTGFAIYKPAQLAWLAALFGGYKGARLIHFLLTLGYIAFFVVHIAQVIRAGWNNFRGMVAGYELVKDNE